MKYLLLIVAFVPTLLGAQSYLDLAKIGYGHTFGNNFEGTGQRTRVGSFEGDLSFPIVLNERHALVTGLIFGRNELQLFPDAPYTTLYSTALKMGLTSTWNGRWGSTLVLLPKVASEYRNISSNDFFIGAFASIKYTRRLGLIYRFGAYASTEAFGLFTTPFFGWYYLSPDQKFEMDFTLPISADLNYRLGRTSVGMDYFGIGRSFNLSTLSAEIPEPSYVDFSSLEFSAYFQVGALQQTVLLRAKIGYASNDFEVYRQDETIDLGLSAFSFGDDRNQLNPNINGGFFAKLEAIYRFQLPGQTDLDQKNE